MASALIGMAAKALAEKVIGSVIDAAVDDFYDQQGWDRNPEQTEIKRKLDALTVQIDALKNQINTLQSAVTDGFLGVKMDSVRFIVADIETRHDRYIDTLLSMEIKDKDKAANDLQNKRKYLSDLGRDNIREIAQLHRKLHGLLIDGADSLFSQAFKKSRIESHDLLQHYIRCRMGFMRYVAVQVKGLALLTLAHKDKEVTYPNASREIESLKVYLDAEEEAFKDIFGFDQAEVASYLLSWAGASETQDLPKFVIRSCKYSSFLKSRSFGEWRGDGISFDHRPEFWYVTPIQYKKAAQADLDTRYTFNVRPRTPALRLRVSSENNSRALLQKLSYSGEDDHVEWRIYSVTKDRLKFECRSWTNEWDVKSFSLGIAYQDGDHRVIGKEVKKEDNANPPAESDPQECFQLTRASRFSLLGQSRMNPLDHPIEPYNSYHLLSNNGKYQLGMLYDGTIQVTDTNSGQVLWKIAGPWNGDGCLKRLVFQGDGNLVAYKATPRRDNGEWRHMDDKPEVYFATNTVDETSDGAFQKIQLEDTGRLVMRGQDGKELWSRN